MEWRKFEARIIEVGCEYTLTPSYIGHVDFDYVRKFWGLDDKDVVRWVLREYDFDGRLIAIHGGGRPFPCQGTSAKLTYRTR